MCEIDINVKVIQDTLGHKDISQTLNIYTDVTKELKRSEFEGLDFTSKQCKISYMLDFCKGISAHPNLLCILVALAR